MENVLDGQAAYWDRVAEEKNFTLPFNEKQFRRLVDSEFWSESIRRL